MKPADVRCGVVVYSKRDDQIRTCKLPAKHLFEKPKAGIIFGFCTRHDARLKAAFPDAGWERLA